LKRILRWLALPWMPSCAALALLAVSAPCNAQAVDEALVKADSLFREGQTLLHAGNAAAACPKFEESERLDPKLGRLLNVAYCHEQVGRIATAWSEYSQAAAVASQAAQSDRETFARERAGELARKLSFMRIDLSAAAEVTDVTVDGKPLARDQWAIPFAVDPGTHVLGFGAPGHKTRLVSVAIGGPGTTRVNVDPLEAGSTVSTPERAAMAAPAAPAPLPASEPPAPAAHRGTSVLGWVLGGVGIAAVGAGAGFALHAMSLKSEADPECPNKLCTPQGKALIGDARTASTIATVGFAVGVVALGAGTWLLLRVTPGGGTSSVGVARAW